MAAVVVAGAPGQPRDDVTRWLAAAAVVWGGWALFALLGPFAEWSIPWRYAGFGFSTAVEGALFWRAARRADLGPRLRLALGISAAAFGVSAFSYLYSGAATLGALPPFPTLLDDVLTFATYGIAVVGLLCWPLAPLPRGRWWHFGLDATIGIAGMGLFFWVLSTLPGDPVGAPSQRGFLLALSAAQLLDLVALNVVLVRGLPLPTPRAFRMYMVALGLEVVSLVVIQYFAATLPPYSVSRYDDALYIVVQLLYVLAGVLILLDPVEEPAPSPLPPWLLTFNPLPLLAIAGVAALFLSEVTRGDGAIETVLALGLVLLVALQTIRLVATVGENARLVQHEAALQGEKLEALRRISGGISHEFNNMLTAVIGHAELGLTEVDPGSRVGRDLEGIRAAAERASVLTRELLAYSGGQFTGRERLDLGAELRRQAPRIRQAAGSRVSVIVQLPDGPARVIGDRAQLVEMVLALARHAERRMPSGGTLTLELQRALLQAPVGVAAGTLPAGAYLRLAVTDTGPALPRPAVERIFEPFSTSADSGIPALGLAAVQGVVAAHGGGIVAASEPEQGLQLTLYLPEAAGAPATDGAA